MIGIVVLRMAPYGALGALIGMAYFAALAWNVRLYAGHGAGSKALLIHLSRLAVASRGVHAMCQARRRAAARKLRGVPRDTDDLGQSLQARAREESMNHSPLEAAILFHIGIVPISRTVVTTWGLMAALTVASWIATRSFRVDAGGWQAMIETVVVGIEEQIAALLNRDAAPFLPLLGTLFIFLVVANLCGIVPGVTAPTASIETPAALAAIVFLSVHFYGVRIQGLGAYLKGYLQAESGHVAVQYPVRTDAIVLAGDAPVRKYHERGAGGRDRSGAGRFAGADSVHGIRNSGWPGAGLHIQRPGRGLYRRRHRRDREMREVGRR